MRVLWTAAFLLVLPTLAQAGTGDTQQILQELRELAKRLDQIELRDSEINAALKDLESQLDRLEVKVHKT